MQVGTPPISVTHPVQQLPSRHLPVVMSTVQSVMSANGSQRPSALHRSHGPQRLQVKPPVPHASSESPATHAPVPSMQPVQQAPRWHVPVRPPSEQDDPSSIGSHTPAAERCRQGPQSPPPSGVGARASVGLPPSDPEAPP